MRSHQWSSVAQPLQADKQRRGRSSPPATHLFKQQVPHIVANSDGGAVGPTWLDLLRQRTVGHEHRGLHCPARTAQNSNVRSCQPGGSSTVKRPQPRASLQSVAAANLPVECKSRAVLKKHRKLRPQAAQGTLALLHGSVSYLSVITVRAHPFPQLPGWAHIAQVQEPHLQARTAHQVLIR